MLHKLRARMQNEKGFTLIELLVVIIILGVLAAAAIEVEELPGVGLVDLRTVREDGPRLIGNVAIEVELDPGRTRVLAGFENHGGRTLLGTGGMGEGRGEDARCPCGGPCSSGRRGHGRHRLLRPHPTRPTERRRLRRPRPARHVGQPWLVHPHGGRPRGSVRGEIKGISFVDSLSSKLQRAGTRRAKPCRIAAGVLEDQIDREESG